MQGVLVTQPVDSGEEAEMEEEELLTEDQVFAADCAEVMSALVDQDCSPTDAVRHLAGLCEERSQQHRSAHLLHLLLDVSVHGRHSW